MPRVLDVLTVGAGAVGSLFASCIHRNPNIRLTILCRSNYEQVKKHGLEIFQRRTGPVVIRPHNVVPSLSSLSKGTSFQYVVFANKVTRSSNDHLWTDAFDNIGRDDTTSFVTAQNGIFNESLLQQAFPQNPVLSAICYASVTRTGPRSVMENLRMHPHCFNVGAFTKCKTSIDGAQELVELGGHDFSFIENVEVERWKKMILNASFNTTATLFNADSHVIMDDAHMRSIAMRLGQETLAVGKALGARLDDSIVPETFEAVRKTPAFRPSTLQDRLAGHPLEIDPICGQLARIGQVIGLRVPSLLAVCQELELVSDVQRDRGTKQTNQDFTLPSSFPSSKSSGLHRW